jgi:hypothetical protein
VFWDVTLYRVLNTARGLLWSWHLHQQRPGLARPRGSLVNTFGRFGNTGSSYVPGNVLQSTRSPIHVESSSSSWSCHGIGPLVTRSGLTYREISSVGRCSLGHPSFWCSVFRYPVWSVTGCSVYVALQVELNIECSVNLRISYFPHFHVWENPTMLINLLSVVLWKGRFTLNTNCQYYHINNSIDRVTTLLILMTSSIDENVLTGCKIVCQSQWILSM